MTKEELKKCIDGTTTIDITTAIRVQNPQYPEKFIYIDPIKSKINKDRIILHCEQFNQGEPVLDEIVTIEELYKEILSADNNSPIMIKYKNNIYESIGFEINTNTVGNKIVFIKTF